MRQIPVPYRLRERPRRGGVLEPVQMHTRAQADSHDLEVPRAVPLKQSPRTRLHDYEPHRKCGRLSSSG
jgi:hypothetical protein